MNLPKLFPEIRSTQLRLRLPAPDDAGFLFRLYNDPAVWQYLDMAPHNSIDDTRLFLEEIRFKQQSGEALYYLVFTDSSEPAGVCRLTGINQKHQFAALGYELLPAQWGRGIMTSAVKLLTETLLTSGKLYRLEAQTHVDNAASVRLLKRCGFRCEGELLGNFNRNGRMENSFLYAITRPQIQALVSRN